MNETKNKQSLINAVKARGWQDATRTVLDVIEPIAPLVSQLLWVVQPMSTIIGARDMVNELAEALENPVGLAHLRKELDDSK